MKRFFFYVYGCFIMSLCCDTDQSIGCLVCRVDIDPLDNSTSCTLIDHFICNNYDREMYIQCAESSI